MTSKKKRIVKESKNSISDYPKFAGKWKPSCGWTPQNCTSPLLAPPPPPLPVRQVQANPDTSWAPRKVSMGYTGSAVLGVATMHKSNAVPVFSKDEASEISQMEK